jgi:hypothetical protein
MRSERRLTCSPAEIGLRIGGTITGKAIFWQQAKPFLMSSPAVNYPSQEKALLLINDVGLLEIDDPITEIVEAYVQHKLMPQNPLGDALHLALASYYKCDFLLTWNCKHLANANKFDHIGRVNTLLGLYVPKLVTPLELLGG